MNLQIKNPPICSWRIGGGEALGLKWDELAAWLHQQEMGLEALVCHDLLDCLHIFELSRSLQLGRGAASKVLVGAAAGVEDEPDIAKTVQLAQCPNVL